MTTSDDTKEALYARVRKYARNRAIANGRDPALAADLAELEYARNNEQSIEAAVEAAAGRYEPDPTKRKPAPRPTRGLSLSDVHRAFDEEFGS